MASFIVRADTLNLPSALASKMRGKELKLVEKGETIVIMPAVDYIDTACGMFTGTGIYGTESITRNKQLDKELEFCNRKGERS